MGDCMGRALFASVAIVALWSGEAQAQTANRNFDIAAGEMHSALQAYARQAGVQLLWVRTDVDGLRSNGVKGSLPPREALERLIGNEELEVVTDSSGALSVRRRLVKRKSSQSPDIEGSTEPAKDIIVTGSRIKRDPFSSPDPLEVIETTREEMRGRSGTAQIIQGSPAAAGSFQQGNFLQGLSATGGTGANTISLRGLGAQRTLTLLNGRRLGPAGIGLDFGPADLNVLPETAIDRIEILKTGASSVYGSDAIGGVVNVITRRNTDGIEIGANTELPFQRGGEIYKVFGTFGKTYERGGFTISFQYDKQTGLRAGQRDFSRCQQDLLYDPATGDRVDIDPATGRPPCLNRDLFGGTAFEVAAFAGPFAFQTFYPSGDPDGPVPGFSSLDPFNFLQFYGTADSRYLRSFIYSPIERIGLFADGAIDTGLLGGSELYGEVLASQRDSTNFNWGPRALIVPESAPLNPFGGDVQIKPLLPSPSKTRVRYVNGTVGLRGDLAVRRGWLKNWSYDAYVSYSRSEGRSRVRLPLRDRYEALIGATVDPTSGRLQCPASAPPGCIPLNLLDPETLTRFPENGFDYLYPEVEVDETTFDRVLANLSFSGDLFDLPAGAIGAAIGVEYRDESFGLQPIDQRFSGNYLEVVENPFVEVGQTTSEAFGELQVPLLKGQKFADDVTLNGSLRYTKYSGYEADWTYKIGLRWQFSPSIGIRGTYGTSFRSPDVAQRSRAASRVERPAIFVDPCVNWGANPSPAIQETCARDGIPAGFNGGGGLVTLLEGTRDLRPETSRAWTASIVWTPQFANLNVAIDYFDIRLEDEPTNLGVGTVLANCYALSFLNGPGFCQFVRRDTDPTSPTFQALLQVDGRDINALYRTSRGIDVALRYQRDFRFGTVRLDSQNTYSLENEVSELDGTVVDFAGTFQNPRFNGNLQLSLQRNDWTVAWSTDYFSPVRERGVPKPAIFPAPLYYGDSFEPRQVRYVADAGWYFLHTLSFRYKATNWELLGGIRNVFDRAPPAISAVGLRVGTAPLASQYDLIGRTAFLTVRRSF